MAPPIFMPRLEILGQIWCFMSKKASPWKKFKDPWGKKPHLQKNSRIFGGKKASPRKIFFGPPNLKILPPSLLNRKTQSSFWVTVWAFHIGFEFLNIVLQYMSWVFDRNKTPGLGFRVGFITRITWSPHLGSGHLLTGHESYAVDWYHWDRRKIVRKLILEQICR